MQLKTLILKTLDKMKAQDVQTLPISRLTTIADYFIVATGTSSRHTQAIADTLLETLKKHKHPPAGVEGQDTGEWILLDCNDIVVHIMLAKTRDFYALEKLWSLQPR